MTRPFLLMTNDDGIHAPGLKTLWKAVREFADVAIVAPLIEKSGCGLGITWGKPLRIAEVEWEGAKAWSLNGTPADCVKMGLSVLLDRRPDLIISGINRGSNSGRTALYSGTIGGVIEGSMKGIPGIAFSFSDYDSNPSAETAKKYVFPLIQYFLKHPLPAETILNVNFPYNCDTEIKGVRLAKQGKGHWIEQPDKRIHPEGLPYYWLGGRWHSDNEEPDSDVALLEQGYITAVPLQVGQLTHREVYSQHKEGLQQKFEKMHTSETLGNLP